MISLIIYVYQVHRIHPFARRGCYDCKPALHNLRTSFLKRNISRLILAGLEPTTMKGKRFVDSGHKNCTTKDLSCSLECFPAKKKKKQTKKHTGQYRDKSVISGTLIFTISDIRRLFAIVHTLSSCTDFRLKHRNGFSRDANK